MSKGETFQHSFFSGKSDTNTHKILHEKSDLGCVVLGFLREGKLSDELLKKEPLMSLSIYSEC